VLVSFSSLTGREKKRGIEERKKEGEKGGCDHNFPFLIASLQ